MIEWRSVRLRATLAVGALGFLLAMLMTGARPRQAQFVAFEAAGVMAETPAAVHALALRVGKRHWALEHAATGWRSGGSTLAPALGAALDLAVKYLHTARPVRILEAADVDARSAEYGLAAPLLELTASMADGQTLTLAFGGPTPDGALQYLRVEGRGAMYLMSGFVGAQWMTVAQGLP